MLSTRHLAMVTGFARRETCVGVAAEIVFLRAQPEHLDASRDPACRGASDGVDESRLGHALADGRARAKVFEDLAVSLTPRVEGSPHLFLADGSDVHDPGIEHHWEVEPGRGFPVIDKDDATVYPDPFATSCIMTRIKGIQDVAEVNAQR
ncbi:MAG: hypothetical protein M3360_03355 [Actinomycetota bacterium]|nr:hypothetical protein [Actinomycetota bacterium]